MRQSSGVRFAVLALVAYNPDGVHGYALKRQCDRILGHLWQLNFPEVYRVLEQLAGDGWIQALGAEPAGVLWIVMREVLLLLTIGLVIGIPSAIALGRYVSSQLYGIQANDPWIAVATMAVLALVSIAAGLIPANKASKIDPILALRYE